MGVRQSMGEILTDFLSFCNLISALANYFCRKISRNHDKITIPALIGHDFVTQV